MPKRVISFKPTDECERQLAELMTNWGCDRTTALIKAVGVAYSGGETPSHVKWANGVADGTTVPVGKSKGRKSLPPSSRIDRDKLDAFQRKTGMARTGKR